MNKTHFMCASDGLELKLLECGKEKCIADKKFSFTPKGYHLFHYVISGKGCFVDDGKKHNLKKGHIFYIPPGEVRRYFPDNDDPWTYIWLGFDGTKAQYLLNHSGFSETNSIFYDGENHPLKGLFNNLYDVYQGAGFLNLECLGLGYQIFSNMIDIYIKETRLSDPEIHLHKAKEFIYNNYQFHISVLDVATNVGVASNYLSGIFKKYEGISTKQFLTKVRMERALILIKSGQLNIKKIAELVGYKNQLHFSGEFKKHFGYSPMNIPKKGYGYEKNN